LAAAIALFALVVAGCSEREEITRYRASKASRVESGPSAEHPPHPHTSAAESAGPRGATADGEDRMLAAAVLPPGDTAWFFKIAGPTAAVADQEQAFLGFVRSLKFAGSGNAPPEWTAPSGWRKKRTGHPIHFAVFEVGPAEKPLEVTVTPLPRRDRDDTRYLVENVNRWRVQQMGLSPIEARDLDRQTKKLSLAGASGVLVDLTGKLSRGMRPPFATGVGDGR
jgi:hypothetical protein